MTFDEWLETANTDRITLRDAWQASRKQAFIEAAGVCDDFEAFAVKADILALVEKEHD